MSAALGRPAQERHAHPIEVLHLGNADIVCERTPRALEPDEVELQREYRLLLAKMRVANEAQEPQA